MESRLRRVRGKAQFAAQRVEWGDEGGLWTKPVRPGGGVRQAEAFGGQARTILSPLAHEEIG